jgi:hypothetical protein
MGNTLISNAQLNINLISFEFKTIHLLNQFLQS